MAKINFMDREDLLREIEIQEDVVTIGREATNKLVIADPSVSRQHATIEKKHDGYYLVDKGSSNGTYINGKRITQQKLVHKDKINLGSASVVFEDEEQMAATFILPQDEAQSAGKPDLHVISSNERPTNALEPEEILPLEEVPLPPPAPLLSVPSAPKLEMPVAPGAPSPPEAEPVAEAPGILCHSCRKVVESNARFCPYCGASLIPAKPAEPPQPVEPPPAPAKPAPAPEPAAPKVAPAPIPPPPKPAPAPAAAPLQVPSFGVSTEGLNYAGFGVRLVAYLIDSVLITFFNLIICIPGLVMFVPAMMRNEQPTPFAIVVLVACALVAMIVSLIYTVHFVGAKGATLGKRMMKLRVTLPDGKYPIGYGKAFLRLIGYMISGLICYIGFLMIAFDKEQHRGLHDKIAGTVVIKES